MNTDWKARLYGVLRLGHLYITVDGFFMFVTCMAASARSHSQTVRLTGKAMTLPALFKAVRSQTGYVFAFGEHVLDGAKEVRLPAGTLSLTDLLDKALHPQGLAYSIESKTIVVTKAPARKTPAQGDAPM
ncbi:MAG: STN domain-containing protein, partial [Arachidicoccus sp.]|nr:STN domain-containing protein [Arachidicoccus sp.]